MGSDLRAEGPQQCLCLELLSSTCGNVIQCSAERTAGVSVIIRIGRGTVLALYARAFYYSTLPE